MNVIRLNAISTVPLLIMLGMTLWFYPSLPDSVPVNASISGAAAESYSKNLIALIRFAPNWLSMPNSKHNLETVFIAAGVMFCLSHFGMLAMPGDNDFFVNYFTWGMCAFLIISGNVIGKTERNINVGILLPWTLASEANWRVTHRLAGRLMVMSGIVLALANLWISHIGLPIAASVFPFLVASVYSYWYYRNYERKS